MKTLVRKNESRIRKDDKWKKSYYAFVPYQTHFGELCGFADDIVFAGQGFGMHAHQNMEISTIVVEGSQAHQDNTGSSGIIGVHSVQTMSAGTGIMHSEYNASKTHPFHSFQIWVYPKTFDAKPRHEEFNYEPKQMLNNILLSISPDRRKNSALINQDAFISLLKLEKNRSISYSMNLINNGVYIHTVDGKIKIGENFLCAGDAIGVYETSEFGISSEEESELIFVEVPMMRGIKI